MLNDLRRNPFEEQYFGLRQRRFSSRPSLIDRPNFNRASSVSKSQIEVKIDDPNKTVKKRNQVEIKISDPNKAMRERNRSLFSRSISFHLNRETGKVYSNPKLSEKIRQIVPKLHVDLSNWSLIDDDVPMIVDELIEKKKCNELWLNENKLTDRAGAFLALALSNNPDLNILDLSSNPIGDLGVWSLSKVLKAPNFIGLKILFLRQSKISDVGAAYLSEMLKTNRTIKELWLSDNDISFQGFSKLIEVLTKENRTLAFLSLSRNFDLNDSIVEPILRLFESNRTIRKLSIQDCRLTENGKQILRTNLNGNRKFRIDV